MSDYFFPSQALEFLAQSDVRLYVRYTPRMIQIAQRNIFKEASVLPHWHIAPSQGEALSFAYLRNLHARF